MSRGLNKRTVDTGEEVEETVLPVTVNAEYRCPVCKKLFFKGTLAPGSAIEMKCSRCKKQNSIFKI